MITVCVCLLTQFNRVLRGMCVIAMRYRQPDETDVFMRWWFFCCCCWFFRTLILLLTYLFTRNWNAWNVAAFEYTLSRVLCIPHGSWSIAISIVLCVSNVCVCVYVADKCFRCYCCWWCCYPQYHVPNRFDEMYIRFAQEICNNIVWCYDLSHWFALCLVLSGFVFVVSGYRARSLFHSLSLSI